VVSFQCAAKVALVTQNDATKREQDATGRVKTVEYVREMF